ERGIAIFPDRVEEFRESVDKAIEYARALECGQVNCLAGIAPAGVDRGKLEETFVANLKFAAERLEQARVRLLVEMINDKVDIPGFFLTNTRQALGLLERVGSANLYLQ